MTNSIKYPLWLIQGLNEHIDNPDLLAGVDLDANGEIANTEYVQEILNTDNDPEHISRQELQNFLNTNREFLITKFGNTFPLYFRLHDIDQGLSPDNPLLTIFAIEQSAHLITDEQLNVAYQKIIQALEIMQSEPYQDLSPREILERIYDAMEEVGIDYHGTPHGALLTRNLAHNQIEVDCDLNSYIIWGIAHELGITQIYLRGVPGHIFVCYDDENGTRFNIDRRESYGDYDYLRNYGLSLGNIEGSANFHRLNEQEVFSQIYSNCADRLSNIGNRQEALTFLQEALRLDSQNIYAYYILLTRGSIAEVDDIRRLDVMPDDMQRILGEAHALESESPDLLFAMGRAHYSFNEIGQGEELFREATQLYQRRLNSPFFGAYIYFGMAASIDWSNASDDLAKLLERLATHYQYGREWIKDENYENALREFAQARRIYTSIEQLNQSLERNENGTAAYLNSRLAAPIDLQLGKASFGLENYRQAIEYLDSYISQFPLNIMYTQGYADAREDNFQNYPFGNSSAYIYRASSYILLGAQQIRRGGRHVEEGRALIETGIRDLETVTRLDAGYYYGGYEFRRTDTQDPRIDFYHGIAQARLGNFEQAIHHFELSNTQNPDNESTLDELQLAHTEMAMQILTQIETYRDDEVRSELQNQMDYHLNQAIHYSELLRAIREE